MSERLLMQEIGSAVVYDGEQALTFVEENEPEVMVLDLKMPGINGLEVLRRVKAAQPQIQVIILTGHGSTEDERMCMMPLQKVSANYAASPQRCPWATC